METLITFSPDGTAEVVPLHEIGRLEIRRATNLEFDNGTQRWEVKDRRAR